MKNHINLLITDKNITDIIPNKQTVFVTLQLKSCKIHEFTRHEKSDTLSHLKLSILKEKYNTKLDFEYLGGEIIGEITKYGSVFVVDLEQFDPNEAALIINGMYLRSWIFDEFKKKEKIENITSIVKDINKTNDVFYNHLKKTSDGVLFAQRMCALPPNVLTPKRMVEEIKLLFQEEKDITITILDKNDIQKQNLNLLYNVGKGSVNDPYVAIIQRGNNPSTALLGKGVTFDTGGISLKPSDSMIDMKKDMAGAASVLGAIYSTDKPVITIVGLVENMIGSNAQRVSDIIISASGDSVEILNTDAEGRLVLADLMTLAQTYSDINEIIDVATLTGAVGVALGTEYAAIMSNNNKLSKTLIESGKETGDLLWPLPCGEEYNHHLKSEIADLKNIGTKGKSGSIAGAKFIEYFLKNKEIAWAHMDIAYSISKITPLSHQCSNGFGVRLLKHYLENKNSCCNKKTSCCV